MRFLPFSVQQLQTIVDLLQPLITLATSNLQKKSKQIYQKTRKDFVKLPGVIRADISTYTQDKHILVLLLGTGGRLGLFLRRVGGRSRVL